MNDIPSIQLLSGRFEEVKIKDKISLTFLDPPDNEDRKYDTYKDKIPEKDYIHLLHRWTYKACEITDGPVFISIADRWVNAMEYYLCYHPDQLIQRIYWRYSFGQNSRTKYTPSVRPIYWLNKNTIYPNNIKIPSARQEKYGDKRAKAGGRLPDNVWDFNRICGTFKEKRKWHCTQHPEALMKRIILGHSKEGDTVMDGFVGSGTTAYCCHETNRKFIGIDLSEFYIGSIKEEFKKRYNIII